MHQALIPLESLRAELRRRLEMIRRQRPFPGRSIGTFGGPARAPAIHIEENTMNTNITRRITLSDVFTARQSGEQDAQTLLGVMAEFVTEAGQPDFSSTALTQSLYPIIDLAQQHRIEECMARLEGFAEIIGPVLERIAGIEAEHALLSASQSATQAERITPEEQRAVNAAISTCSMVSASRIIAAHPNDDDATVTLSELQLAVRALEPKFTETEGGEL